MTEEACIHGMLKPPLQPEMVLDVLHEVYDERARQDEKWGEQNHPDLFGPESDQEWWRRRYEGRANGWKADNAARVAQRNHEGAPSDRNAAWDGVLLEEVYEALAEPDPAKRRAELVQVAAVAVAWIEAIDRRKALREAS